MARTKEAGQIATTSSSRKRKAPTPARASGAAGSSLAAPRRLAIPVEGSDDDDDDEWTKAAEAGWIPPAAVVVLQNARAARDEAKKQAHQAQEAHRAAVLQQEQARRELEQARNEASDARRQATTALNAQAQAQRELTEAQDAARRDREVLQATMTAQKRELDEAKRQLALTQCMSCFNSLMATDRTAYAQCEQNGHPICGDCLDTLLGSCIGEARPDNLKCFLCQPDVVSFQRESLFRAGKPALVESYTKMVAELEMQNNQPAAPAGAIDDCLKTPCCNFPMAEFEGCAAIFCACGSNFCAWCFEVFDGSQPCHAHLRTKSCKVNPKSHRGLRRQRRWDDALGRYVDAEEEDLHDLYYVDERDAPLLHIVWEAQRLKQSGAKPTTPPLPYDNP